MSGYTKSTLIDLRQALATGRSAEITGVTYDYACYDGLVMPARAGIIRSLLEVGYEIVAWVDPSSNIAGINGEHDEAMRAIPGFDANGEWAANLLALTAQGERPVAVVVDGAAAILESDQDGELSSRLLRGARDAAVVGGLKNGVVLLSPSGSALPPMLAGAAAYQRIAWRAPNQAERMTALSHFGPQFYGVDKLSRSELSAALEKLAFCTDGDSLSELRQLQEISLREQVSVTDPTHLRTLREGRRKSVDWELRKRRFRGRIEELIAAHIVGQPHAVAAFAESLEGCFDRSPTEDPESTGGRPRAILFFTGPSGTGKTEMARALARIFFGTDQALVRIDCGNLGQAHSEAVISGAAPGYVGYDDLGPLARLLDCPASVVLVDEADKASDTILNTLLRPLDDGVLVRNDGHQIPLDETVFIFTSNYGQSELLEEIRTGSISTPEEVIAAGRVLATQGVGGGGDTGAAFLSRLGGQPIGFDIFRRSSLPEFMKKLERRIAIAASRTSAAPHVVLDIDGYVQFLDDRLPEDGHWDGRAPARLAQPSIDRHFADIVDRGIEGTVVISPTGWWERDPDTRQLSSGL